jgi:hypothetical protein
VVVLCWLTISTAKTLNVTRKDKSVSFLKHKKTAACAAVFFRLAHVDKEWRQIRTQLLAFAIEDNDAAF